MYDRIGNRNKFCEYKRVKQAAEADANVAAMGVSSVQNNSGANGAGDHP